MVSKRKIDTPLNDKTSESERDLCGFGSTGGLVGGCPSSYLIALTKVGKQQYSHVLRQVLNRSVAVYVLVCRTEIHTATLTPDTAVYIFTICAGFCIFSDTTTGYTGPTQPFVFHKKIQFVLKCQVTSTQHNVLTLPGGPLARY